MSSEKTPQLTYLLAPAMRGPVEVTLRSLLVSYDRGVDSDLLESAMMVSAALDAFGLTAEPSLGVAGLDAPLVVKPIGHSSVLGLAQASIASGEGARVEFKSTLLLSVDQRERDPALPLSDCRSAGVTKSALKTIAAFLNTGGGTLLIGIKDDGSCYGLTEDMALADPSKADFDGWELELRRQVEKFFPVKAINSYITVDKFVMEDKVAARVEVAARAELTFMKIGDSVELYIRSGNRSIPIPFIDIEQYFKMGKRF